MIDTRHALQFSDELDSVENKEYVYSWQDTGLQETGSQTMADDKK